MPLEVERSPGDHLIRGNSIYMLLPRIRNANAIMDLETDEGTSESIQAGDFIVADYTSGSLSDSDHEVSISDLRKSGNGILKLYQAGSSTPRKHVKFDLGISKSYSHCNPRRKLNFGFSSSSFHIPQTVLDKIMRKVPFEHLLRFRLVSKEWNKLIMSKHWTSATNLRSQMSRPLLIKCRGDSLTSAVFLTLTDNCGTSKWKQIKIDLQTSDSEAASHPTSSSSLYRRCRRTSRNHCLEFLRCTTAGSLGLMFFTRYCASHFDSDFSLLVYNPVTKMVKSLKIPEFGFPAELNERFATITNGCLRLVGVLTGVNDLHYKLLFATVTERNELSFRRFFVYDSQNGSWKFRVSNHEDEIQPLFQIISAVCCNGRFYFLHTRSGGAENFHPNLNHGRRGYLSSLFRPLLGVYDSKGDKLKELPLVEQHTYRGTPYFPQLVHHKGAVYYVVLCQTELQSGGRGENKEVTWCFFRLNHRSDQSSGSSSVSWTRVREMPLNIFRVFDLYTLNFDNHSTGKHDVRCEGQGDYVYFYCVRPSNILRPSVANLMSSSSQGVQRRPGPVEGAVLLHDFEKNEWRFLKRYPPFGNDDLSGAKLESFRPSFVDV
ncbi:hypothetical protein R1sor_023243 [Riccia sorocarpa]|uniref:F-box domain-containing protein n=1 Tax=Riccia sorocarpa TaxID=122646 RepID=A0ABD3GQ45_9MARC